MWYVDEQSERDTVLYCSVCRLTLLTMLSSRDLEACHPACPPVGLPPGLASESYPVLRLCFCASARYCLASESCPVKKWTCHIADNFPSYQLCNISCKSSGAMDNTQVIERKHKIVLQKTYQCTFISDFLVNALVSHCHLQNTILLEKLGVNIHSFDKLWDQTCWNKPCY